MCLRAAAVALTAVNCFLQLWRRSKSAEWAASIQTTSSFSRINRALSDGGCWFIPLHTFHASSWWRLMIVSSWEHVFFAAFDPMRNLPPTLQPFIIVSSILEIWFIHHKVSNFQLSSIVQSLLFIHYIQYFITYNFSSKLTMNEDFLKWIMISKFILEDMFPLVHSRSMAHLLTLTQ